MTAALFVAHGKILKMSYLDKEEDVFISLIDIYARRSDAYMGHKRHFEI